MVKKFQNKTVFITGASAGFGAAIAEEFAQAGARLVLIARRKDRLQQLEKELRAKYSVEILCIGADVSHYDALVKHFSNIPEPFSSPDVLVNNAGMVRGMNKVWETSSQDWNEMIDINVKGVLNLCSLIIPKMLKRESGHIINVGSVSSHDTYPGGGVYCATKFAVKALTDTLRKELVATPLRVSMISPGMANTEFSTVRFYGDKSKADSIYENFKALSAEDVAEIVFFIASRPENVNIADVIVYPTYQASVSLVHREK